MKWRCIVLVSMVLATCALVVNAYAPQADGYRDEVIKYVDEVWTKGNLAYIDQLMDPAVVRYGHADEGNAVGAAAFKERVRAIRSQFTDYNVTLVDMMGVGDKAVFTWKLRGNYVGPDKKISPGRTVDIMGKTAWIVKGGKVIKEIVEMDQEEYYRQIQMAVPYSEVENRAIVLSYLYEVMSRGNVSALEELVAPNHVLHDVHDQTVKGIEALWEHVQDMRTSFPDLTIEVKEIIADGNHVTARWLISGTHKGDWHGVAPTGIRVDASGLSFATVKDGKIQETWSTWDALRLTSKVAKR